MKIDLHAMPASLPNPWCERTTWLLFLVAFFGTCAVALVVQLVLLPSYLPHLHAGHGMLVGSDSEGMHSTAVALAQRIRAEGWSAWELRPAGNAPTGIAAAIYVYLTPEPYTLIPLNALVHASGGLVVYLIVFLITRNKLSAVAGAIPFLVFPSAASWYAQIHKDGMFALGMLLCAFGWMQCFQLQFWKAARPALVSVVLPLALGLLLIWVVRPHMTVLMLAVSILTTVAGLVLVGSWLRRDFLNSRKALIVAAVFIAIPLILAMIKPWDSRISSWQADVAAHSSTIFYNPSQCVIGRGTIPALDKLSTMVAGMRDFFISGYPNAKSNMDPDFVPGTVCNLLAYVPRALQIGFLAPFPSAWLADGSIAASTMMRRVISVEMIATYLALLLLPIALWDYRRKPEFWFVLGFFTLLTVIHVYLVPNLGTLHRMRYGFLTGVVGLAIGGGVQRVLSHKVGRSV